MKKSHLIFWHAIAILTIVIWGASFVSTKVLLNAGFLPTHIYLLRFILAYVILLLASHRDLWAKNLKDELTLLVCGLTAGSIYFIAENTALGFSFASNVSLIVCSNPLLTMIFAGFLFAGERLRKRQVTGSFITLCGMILVVLNGKFILKLSPVGDMLAFTAAFVWTLYSLIVRRLHGVYPVLFITRKIFFYGILTTLPLLPFTGIDVPWAAFKNPVVLGNFLYLGVIASLFCYIMWNKVLQNIGTVLASNYIYAIPLITILFSVAFLHERITAVAILGALMILAGMILAEYKK